MEWNGRCYDRDRWRAGGGTTALGVIGTAAGGAALLGQTMTGNGLFGRCNQNCDADKLRAENAELRAELKMDDKLLERDNRYKDDLERFYGRFEIVAGRLATLESEHQCLQKQLTDYAIHQKEIDELERKLLRKDIEGVNKDLGCLAGKVETMGITFANRLNGIDALIGSFTSTVVKESAICDTGCNRACGQ
jgi:hypothetical protein